MLSGSIIGIEKSLDSKIQVTLIVTGLKLPPSMLDMEGTMSMYQHSHRKHFHHTTGSKSGGHGTAGIISSRISASIANYNDIGSLRLDR